MDVLVLRHGLALDHMQWRDSHRPDSERPLTDAGREQMRRCAAGLAHTIHGLTRIVTSPYLRAAETARILAAAFPEATLKELNLLASGGSRQDVLHWLVGRDEDCIALVGHEPDLGELIGLCAFGDVTSAVPLPKAGACLLRFHRSIKPGKAEIRWMLRPAQLERLGVVDSVEARSYDGRV